MGNLLYRFRGWILGLMALALIVIPGAPLDSSLYPSAVCSTLLLVASAILRIQTRRSIGEHTRGYIHAADTLVTTGVYSRIRHPLYVSNTGIALAAIFWHFGISFTENYSADRNQAYFTAMAFTLAICVFEFILSKMEDRFLQKKFGNQWQAWASVTPSFFPKLSKGKSVTGKYVRSFATAFTADKSTWFWLAVIFAAITIRKTF